MSVTAAIGLSIFLLAGTLTSLHARRVQYDDSPEDVDDNYIRNVILSSIDPKRIEENLRVLTRKTHIAGRARDFELVSFIQKHFSDHGLHVQTTPYDVLLSYPSNITRTSVRIVDKTGKVFYDTVTDENDIPKDVIPPYHAYAPQGLVEGDAVYAGYGRTVEYETLLKLGINVTGKIVIVKYGKLFRGSKVLIAQSYGAIGVIMYSDPIDVTGKSRGDSRVFPDAWWLPPKGVQRGSVYTGNGDPLTPGYPSNRLGYRWSESQIDPPLPRIPSQPIGYLAAYQILRYLSGPPAPKDWTGGFNLTYSLGPGFLQPGFKLQLNVTNQYQRDKVENVFGIIKGTVEPDRYVLMGNHRDAWSYGGVDPSSGTALMMEISRVMGDFAKYGCWKPRRTIIFCSWGAEEFGLTGSTEWVEQYVATLKERAVGYINVDLACAGNSTPFVSSAPLFQKVVYEASKKVPNPNPEQEKAGKTTVYDGWLSVLPYSDQFTGSPIPIVTSLGSSSDYTSFIQIAGVTSIDLLYLYDPNVYPIPIYPVYHTEYDTFDLVKKLIDPDFKVQTALAKVVAEMTRSLADSVILPFNITDYAVDIERYRLQLDADFGLQLKQNVPNYGLLEEVIKNFTADVTDFEAKIKTMDKTNLLALRSVNDRIMQLERAFLTPEGLPLRPYKKHILIAESSSDVYAATTFPGLTDILVKIDVHPDGWEKVRRHFSTILQTIQSAGATLRDVTHFMSETL